MSPLRYILRYVLPYKGYIALNIVFNILYAFFNAASFLALMPMLEVLFGKNKTQIEMPTREISNSYLEYIFDSFRFQIADYAKGDATKALMLVIGVILITFLLKNLFNYFAVFFITYMRNGVVKDIQRKLYESIYASLFYDAGNANEDIFTSKASQSLGTGLVWESPFGDIELSLAWPIQNYSIDQDHYKFHIALKKGFY